MIFQDIVPPFHTRDTLCLSVCPSACVSADNISFMLEDALLRTLLSREGGLKKKGKEWGR